ncbi:MULTISPECIES: MerR family transcriptional regulator [Bacillaceae]|uniref:MerR family transcriptional regulator n=1 Tax=Evansella alkalicola TaxID=745819 RepID=A0ABS6JMV4_9BACI|nr:MULTISPECIES: MerR family transcriptional regulator [Bacillaceae]MBU9719893.1 MerR family transcriptional regulator [Bacillus alkalicola]
MQIKDVEKRTGLTKKAIRYYEEAGLIQTERKENRYKEYSEDTVDTLLHVKQLRLLDFSIEEIKLIFSEENHEDIIYEKMKQNEEKLKQAYGVKKVLEKVLDGESVRALDVEQLLLDEKKQTYTYIRNNNLLFGLINVLAFVAIYMFFFSRMETVGGATGNLMVLLFVQVTTAAVWMGVQEKRKKRARAEGILMKEIKPLERIVQFAVHTFTYILSARMCVEGFYYAGKYLEWGESMSLVIGNVALGLFMSTIGLFMLIASFLDTNKEVEDYLPTTN